ncbi:citrate-Mg2+:H+ or citrate-Ca2+:H+ symporter, CitMHS family [Peribacillus simplex]|uniref:Citrate-Mg2+:H+ or citrate-Ca2+:H+ symporter, CitMHS family n=1 Tax=Peribacillus simplex TaxID=1478 RepID=A0A9X8RB10_9BACI|nr:citrate:proton symporter [Peribacillus simplex]SIR70280.1 citrate-Mg2+:H+ or citrate-Ca2+:H+ symporter, CitMHS family [Peribacillus simplex]
MAILGFLMIGTFLYLVMSKRVSVLIAFALVPIIFALIGGFGLEIGKMMLDGIAKVTPTGIMIGFSILYFGLMIDRGLFDPMISRLIRFANGDPLKIVMATAIITLVVALDGDGSATFMITVTALLPIYKRLGMSSLTLAGVVALGAGVMNIIPWGGPLARAMVSLGAESTELFNPIIPAMLAGAVWVVFVSYIFGMRERKRIGIIKVNKGDSMESGEIAATLEMSSSLPKLYWFNLILTISLIVALIMEIIPVPVLFIVAFAIALLVNFPDVKKQQEQIASHAQSMVMVCTTIFAAGIFTGILSGTKMIDAMAVSMVSAIPDWLGGHLPILVAVVSMPLSLIFSPDAFYYGLLPVLSEAGTAFGVDPIEIGRAALLGNGTTGFPLSPLNPSVFVLIGLCKVDLGDLQKKIFFWAFGSTIVMTIVALLTGAIPL